MFQVKDPTSELEGKKISVIKEDISDRVEIGQHGDKQ